MLLKKLRKITIIILSIAVAIWVYDRYGGKKCYLEVPSGVLIFQFTGKTLSGFLEDNCFAEIEVRRAAFKYSPITTQLIRGGTGCWFRDFCPSIVKNGNQIIAFHNFYSTDEGETFIGIRTLLDRIKDQYDVDIYGAKFLHLIQGKLYLTNNRTNLVFTSMDGGKTWSKYVDPKRYNEH